MIYTPKPRLGIQLNRKHPLAKGLVGCWVMNEGTGDKLFDLSWNGNHCTNNGADWVADGLDFDGTDYIRALHDSSIDFADEDFSVSMWVNTTTTAASSYLFSKNYGGAGVKWYGANIYPVGPNITFFVDDGTINSTVGTTDDFNDGEWHHLVFVRDTTANKLIIYVDGLWNAEAVDGSGSIANTGTLTIGCRNDLSVDRFYDGLLNNFLIYNRAISPEEVARLNRESYAMFQPEISPQLYAFFDESITLTVAALDGAGLLDNVALTQKHTLAVQALSGTGAINNVVLTQKHLLALQGLLSSGVLDAVSLTQKHILSVQELSGAGTLDNVTLTQKHILAVQELLSSGTLDNIELSISTLLVVAEMLSSGTLDNIDLTQKHNLIIQELASAGVLDNIELTQKHLLAIQSLLSAGTLDNIELLLSTLLVVADLISAGQLDNVGLTQKHILTVNEVLSAGQLDGVVLTQKNLLTINDLISSGVIDNIQFDIATGLICITLTQATEYNISLTQGTEYNILLTQTGGGVQ